MGNHQTHSGRIRIGNALPISRLIDSVLSFILDVSSCEAEGLDTVRARGRIGGGVGGISDTFRIWKHVGLVEVAKTFRGGVLDILGVEG